jgi:hypothetical protein
MSGLLFNYGGFYAQGTETLGTGVSQEQVSFGTEATANSAHSDTPANIIKLQATALAASASLGGLMAPTD